MNVNRTVIAVIILIGTTSHADLAQSPSSWRARCSAKLSPALSRMNREAVVRPNQMAIDHNYYFIGNLDVVPKHHFEVYVVTGSRRSPQTTKFELELLTLADVAKVSRRRIENGEGGAKGPDVYYSRFLDSMDAKGLIQPIPADLTGLSEALLGRLGRLYPESRDIRVSYLGKYGTLSLVEVVPKILSYQSLRSPRRIYALTEIETLAFDEGETHFRRLANNEDGTTVMRRSSSVMALFSGMKSASQNMPRYALLNYDLPSDLAGQMVLQEILLPDRSSRPGTKSRVWPDFQKVLTEAVRDIRIGRYQSLMHI
jgi:hypothetical protein